MTEHMNIDQYRKETGAPVVRLGERMTVPQFMRARGEEMATAVITHKLERSGKYNAKRTEYNGRVYDSKAEAHMAQELDNARHSHDQDQKVISVEYQKRYRLEVNGKLICTYVADFYVVYATGRTEVIDTKGVLTPVYKLKKKLMLACYDIEIKETL